MMMPFAVASIVPIERASRFEMSDGLSIDQLEPPSLDM